MILIITLRTQKYNCEHRNELKKLLFYRKIEEAMACDPGLNCDRRKRRMNMDFGPFEYVVERIDGDYAALVRCDIETSEEKLVARALLPAEIMEGTHLRYECLTYEIIC